LERSERYRELYETQFRRVLEHERQKNEDNNSTKLSFSD